jgi:hypothetical protein
MTAQRLVRGATILLAIRLLLPSSLVDARSLPSPVAAGAERVDTVAPGGQTPASRESCPSIHPAAAVPLSFIDSVRVSVATLVASQADASEILTLPPVDALPLGRWQASVDALRRGVRAQSLPPLLI